MRWIRVETILLTLTHTHFLSLSLWNKMYFQNEFFLYKKLVNGVTERVERVPVHACFFWMWNVLTVQMIVKDWSIQTHWRRLLALKRIRLWEIDSTIGKRALQESYACMKTVSVHLTFPIDCKSSIVDSFSDRMDTAQCKDCRYKYACLFSDLSSNDFNSHSLTDGSHIRPYRCVTRTRQSHHTSCKWI